MEVTTLSEILIRKRHVRIRSMYMQEQEQPTDMVISERIERTDM